MEFLESLGFGVVKYHSADGDAEVDSLQLYAYG